MAEHVPCTESLADSWCSLQEELAKRVIVKDTLHLDAIRFVGGCDLTFSTSDPALACACITVLDRSGANLLLLREKFFRIDVPFIPGFLGFREVPALLELWQQLRKDASEDPSTPFPDVILLDGNGIMHQRKCGVACHLGVLLGVPTIGVAKTYYQVDGITFSGVRTEFHRLHAFGDWLMLSGPSDTEWGGIVRTSVRGKPASKPRRTHAADGYKGTITPATASAPDTILPAAETVVAAEVVDLCKPIYISVGTGVTLRSAIQLVLDVSLYRVPEPIRIADKHSRQLMALRESSPHGPLDGAE